jgi:histidinol-phosphate aminotransferase
MDAPDFAALAQPGIRGLRAYDPGLDLVALRRAPAKHPLIELGSNENSFGPSPAARAAVLDSLHALHRYPDPSGGDLKRALARHHRVDPDRILLGNGSHELLMMIAQVFAGAGQEVLCSEFGFAIYRLAAQAAGAIPVVVPALAVDHAMPRGHDLSAIGGRVSPATRMVYLANPNNPTGTWFPTAALVALMQRLPSDALVVLDEAYLEYVTDPALVSAVSLLDRFPNLVVTRTFSKAYGLAGLRIGYLIAHPGLVAVMERVRESFNVNLPALAAAEAALADEAHLAWVCGQNAAERQSLADALRARDLAVAPSQTNFLLADFGVDASVVQSGLLDLGVVPRPMAGYGLPQCLRLTVGTRDENRRLLQALDEAMA